MPCICGKKVDRSVSKLKCADCNTFCHANCVNLRESDVDYMIKNKTIFRCDRCKILQRKSISQSSKIISDNSPSTACTASVNDPKNEKVTLSTVYAEIMQLKTLNANAIALINSLQEEKKVLQSRVDSLEKKINFLQHDRRRKYVEIVGVPTVDNTNAVDTVIKICKDGLDVSINKADIEHCYVKNIHSNSSNNNQSSSANNNSAPKNYLKILCVKFNSFVSKQNIMNKRFANKNKLNAGMFGSEFMDKKIYINESLTSYTRSLLKAANKVKESNHYKYLWMRNSTILMRKIEGEPVIRINSFEDLNNCVVNL